MSLTFRQQSFFIFHARKINIINVDITSNSYMNFNVAGHRQLRSASPKHLTVPPRYLLNTFGRLRSFSVDGPTSWNSLPDRLRDPTLSSDSFRGKYLKRGTICELLNSLSAPEMLHDSALCKFTTDIDIDTDMISGTCPPVTMSCLDNIVTVLQ